MEAQEFTRQRLESTLPKDHEDHIAGKGFSMTQYSLVHKFMMPQAMKIPDATAVDKEWKKLHSIPCIERLTRIAAEHSSGAWNNQGLGTWDAPELLAVSGS